MGIFDVTFEVVLYVFCILFLIIKFINIVIQWVFTNKKIATVLHKERVQYKVGGDMYLIYTDEGVYKNVDTLAWFKWNSSDVYANIQVGNTYEIFSCGRRFKLQSNYPNIINIKQVKNESIRPSGKIKREIRLIKTVEGHRIRNRRIKKRNRGY